jgi:hypothetical protein
MAADQEAHTGDANAARSRDHRAARQRTRMSGIGHVCGQDVF